MPLYYHPENKPLKFWGIRKVGSGENAVILQRDEKDAEHGVYRMMLEVRGDKIGGVAEMTNGWLNLGTEGFKEDAARVKVLIMAERPIVHYGSDPAIAIGFMVLILDALSKSRGRVLSHLR